MKYPELKTDAYDTVATEIIIATGKGAIRNQLLDRLNALDIGGVIRAEEYVLSTTEAGVSPDVAMLLGFLERSALVKETSTARSETREPETVE